jgi:hypothetical protein
MTEKRRDDDKRIDNLIVTTNSLTDRITSLVAGVNVFKWLATFVVPVGFAYAVWVGTTLYEIKTSNAVTVERLIHVDTAVQKHEIRLDNIEHTKQMSVRD